MMIDPKTSPDTGSPPPTLHVIPTIYPTSSALEEEVDQFWDLGEQFDAVSVDIQLPETPLEILEQLGPSPFPRGRFPLIGFLATTYDKVSRYAMERRETFVDTRPEGSVSSEPVPSSVEGSTSESQLEEGRNHPDSGQADSGAAEAEGDL
ncbi:MAG: hypothetical protein ACPGXK_04975 [Phycisphaerae bacterium]